MIQKENDEQGVKGTAQIVSAGNAEVTPANTGRHSTWQTLAQSLEKCALSLSSRDSLDLNYTPSSLAPIPAS